MSNPRDEIMALTQLPEDWDSYGASPVPEGAAQNALAFLGILTVIRPDIPLPIIGPLPSCQVGFFWRLSGAVLKEISVYIGESVDPDGCDLLVIDEDMNPPGIAEDMHLPWHEAQEVFADKVIHYLSVWDMLAGG